LKGEKENAIAESKGNCYDRLYSVDGFGFASGNANPASSSSTFCDATNWKYLQELPLISQFR
jgi:hypothetical protein